MALILLFMCHDFGFNNEQDEEGALSPSTGCLVRLFIRFSGVVAAAAAAAAAAVVVVVVVVVVVDCIVVVVYYT